MARRIRNVELVATDDPGYRQHASEHALRNRRLGERQAASPSCALSQVLERAARGLLAETTTLSAERILTCEQQVGPFGYRRTYLELDAVAGSAAAPLCIYEVKATRAAAPAVAARRQVERARRIARRLNGDLSAAIVWVDTSGAGAVPELGTGFVPLPDLRALAAWPGDRERVAFVRLDGESVWSAARAAGLAEDDHLWEAAQRDAREVRGRRALRERLTEAGVPRAEWPAEVRPAPQPVRQAGSYEVGSERTSESAFAIALRGARALRARRA